MCICNRELSGLAGDWLGWRNGTAAKSTATGVSDTGVDSSDVAGLGSLLQLQRTCSSDQLGN